MKFYAIAALLGMLAAPAYSQTDCASTRDVHESLERQGADPVFQGLTESENVVVEIWTLPSGSWVLFVTSKDGYSCGLDRGDFYKGLPPNA